MWGPVEDVGYMSKVLKKPRVGNEGKNGAAEDLRSVIRANNYGYAAAAVTFKV